MCQYNCMSRWQTHVSLSIQHILCNIQYTIYIYIHIIYIYICIHQYLLQFTSICPWACEYMCPSVFHNFVRKKNESTGSHVIKNRAHNMSSAGALDLTCFYPWARNGKNHPQMVVGPMALGESTSGHWKLLVHGKRTTSELVVLGPSGSLTAKKMGKMVV